MYLQSVIKAFTKPSNSKTSKKPNRDTSLQSLSDTELEGLRICINDIDGTGYHKGLYFAPGDATEVNLIVGAIKEGSLTEDILSNISNVNSVPDAIKTVLAQHSPLLDREQLENSAPNHAHIRNIINRLPMSHKNFLHYFASHLLRISRHKESATSSQLLAGALSQLFFCGCQLQTEVDSKEKAAWQTLISFLIENSISLFDQDNGERTDDSKTSGAPPITTIQDRSIKVTFPKDSFPPSEDSLRDMVERFGRVKEVCIHNFFFVNVTMSNRRVAATSISDTYNEEACCDIVC